MNTERVREDASGDSEDSDSLIDSKIQRRCNILQYSFRDNALNLLNQATDDCEELGKL